MFRNLAKRSPAFHLWDDEYLKSLPGANETLVFVEPDLKENRSNVEGARDIPLLEFMEIYHTSPIYMVQGLPKILRYVGMMVLVSGFCSFWTLSLPKGILSNRPCPCVRLCPSLNISETVH